MWRCIGYDPWLWHGRLEVWFLYVTLSSLYSLFHPIKAWRELIVGGKKGRDAETLLNWEVKKLGLRFKRVCKPNIARVDTIVDRNVWDVASKLEDLPIKLHSWTNFLLLYHFLHHSMLAVLGFYFLLLHEIWVLRLWFTSKILLPL